MLGLRSIIKNINYSGIRNISTFKNSSPSLYASFTRRTAEVKTGYNDINNSGYNNNNNTTNEIHRSTLPSGGNGGFGNGNGTEIFDGRNNRRGGFGEQNKIKENINWDLEINNLPTIKKVLYDMPMEHSEELINFMAKHEISCKTKDVYLPTPITDLTLVPFSNKIKEILKKKFTEPTPVQSLGWLVALSGRDMLGVSKTGSGKTLSFILPAIEHILAQGRQPHYSGPSVLVVSPTRELANQISKEAEPYLRAMNLSIATLYGGDSKEGQARQLRYQPKIIVGTPGRIIDFCEEGRLSLKNISFLVVDEADRLMEMGFEDSINSIFNSVRPDRQVLYWSATWPRKVEALASKYIKSPVHLQIGSSELTANKNITQKFKIVESESQKVSALMDTLGEIYSADENAKTLIFTMTKRGADTLCDYIKSNGDNVRIDSLHGDKSQRQREFIVENFRNRRLDIVVATDVASRGLDIKGITHVINFSLPHDCETYVHRIGRTARAGATGISHSILSKSSMDDLELISQLTSLLSRSQQEIPQEFVDFNSNTNSRNNNNNRNGGGRNNYGRSNGGGRGRSNYGGGRSNNGGRNNYGGGRSNYRD